MAAVTSTVGERGHAPSHAAGTSLGQRVWGAGGLVFVALFAGGILAAGGFPAADVSIQGLEAYLAAHRAGLRALGACHGVAAVVLLLFAGRVRDAVAGPERSPGGLAALGFGGAVLAAGGLLASALLFWTLAAPELAGDPGVLRAVHLLSFLAGGVGLLVGLGLFAGCAGFAGRRTRGLPNWVAAAGVAVAAVGLASPLTLFARLGPWGPDGLVPVAGAALSMLWIAATSAALALRPRPPAAS